MNDPLHCRVCALAMLAKNVHEQILTQKNVLICMCNGLFKCSVPISLWLTGRRRKQDWDVDY